MRSTLSHLLTAAALAFAVSSTAQAKAPMSSVAVDAKGVAVGGYDLVAYQTQAAAVKGSSKFNTRHEGATYRFTSKANRDAFVASPDKYLPAFGGYCAFGMAMKGDKVPTNPKTFKFHDGKLLFFYNGPYEGKQFNTKVPWNQKEQALLQKANVNWSKFKKQ